jgi:hypothetical protein
VRQCEPSFVDARAIDNPLRIKSMSFPQILIAHHVLGNIAPRTEDLDTLERPGNRRRMDLTVAHRQYAVDSIGEMSMPILVSHSAHAIIST